MVATLGHAGDGNLHPTFVLPRGDAAAGLRARAAFDEVLHAGLALGGTVTGEHGVGALKRAALAKELHPVAVEPASRTQVGPGSDRNPQPRQGASARLRRR